MEKDPADSTGYRLSFFLWRDRPEGGVPDQEQVPVCGRGPLDTWVTRPRLLGEEVFRGSLNLPIRLQGSPGSMG